MVTVTMPQCLSVQTDPPLTVRECAELGCPVPSHKRPQLSAIDVTLMLNPAHVESTLLRQIQCCQMGHSAMK